MIEKVDPYMGVDYEGIAGTSCWFIGIRDVEKIKVPLLRRIFVCSI